MIYDVRNPGPGLGQTQRCGGVKQIDPNRSPLHSWIFNNNSDIKNLQRFVFSQKDQVLSQI